ncbi:MAG TPA: phosphopantetheine-binding protein [Rhodocyclaceae bacterium]|nr:phosphopantetheine-binding protein [Rhodocyclaceae bacterium]
MNAISLIQTFLQDRLGVAPENVIPDALLSDLGVDSLMQLELMFEFEDRFKITLDEDQTLPRTVGEMVTLVDDLISRQASVQ